MFGSLISDLSPTRTGSDHANARGRRTTRFHGARGRALHPDVRILAIHGYRKDLLDVLPGCFSVFWGIRRA